MGITESSSIPALSCYPPSLGDNEFPLSLPQSPPFFLFFLLILAVVMVPPSTHDEERKVQKRSLCARKFPMDVRSWDFFEQGGQVVIYDANNDTRAARQTLEKKFDGAGIHVVMLSIPLSPFASC
jgi:hypothetical protein